MTEPNLRVPDVVIGSPICRRTAFVLDKFLSNQREIQQVYPGCCLVMATDEPDFVNELQEQINLYRLRGEVITYKTVKPSHARSRLWSVTCGREAVRQYALSRGAEYLLFLDADMVYEPSIVSMMKAKTQDFDIVYSGYRFPPRGDWRFGAGCLMINREILNKVPFRCYEFKNGEVIYEDELFDVDSFRCRAKVHKGIFVSIKHYKNEQEYVAIEPQPVNWFRKVANSPLVRYVLLSMSIAVKFNIPGKLHAWLYRAPRSFSSDTRLAK